MTKPPTRPLLAAAAGAALALSPAAAHAQEYSRWAFRAELGAGTLLQDFTYDGGGTGGVAGQLDARVTLRLVGPLALQAGAGLGRFFRPDRDDVGLIYGAGGLRIEPRLGDFARLWVDGDAGVFAVGTLNRFGVDAGLGFEFMLSRTVALGPFGRFSHVFGGADSPAPPSVPGGVPAGPAPTVGDVQWWVAGLALSFHSLVEAPPPPPPPPPAPADGDGDGVPDPDDQCATAAAGDHPDPARRGCPLADDDHDNVYGDDDRCPTEAAGEHPDPARNGCPAPDDDHDNVYGADDQCPTEAAGAHPNPERAGCPDADGDRDGVFDHGDQCPTEAAGLHPDPARAGCPLPDGDHDNVPDAVDRCPQQPGAPSANPARNGCPGLVVIQDGALRILRPVFFANRSERILPTSTPVLNAVAEALRTTPEIRRLMVEGHTDDVGDDAANLELSRRRAAAVVTWLTTRGRVDAARLASEGFGETRPLAQGATAAARARNRRVEFRIVDVGAEAAPPAAPQPAQP